MSKNTLHMVGLDSRGAIVLREKVSRGRIASRLANVPPGRIQKRKTYHLQIFTFGLQRAAGPYRGARS